MWYDFGCDLATNIGCYNVGNSCFFYHKHQKITIQSLSNQRFIEKGALPHYHSLENKWLILQMLLEPNDKEQCAGPVEIQTLLHNYHYIFVEPKALKAFPHTEPMTIPSFYSLVQNSYQWGLIDIIFFKRMRLKWL